MDDVKCNTEISFEDFIIWMVHHPAFAFPYLSFVLFSAGLWSLNQYLNSFGVRARDYEPSILRVVTFASPALVMTGIAFAFLILLESTVAKKKIWRSLLVAWFLFLLTWHFLEINAILSINVDSWSRVLFAAIRGVALLALPVFLVWARSDLDDMSNDINDITSAMATIGALESRRDDISVKEFFDSHEIVSLLERCQVVRSRYNLLCSALWFWPRSLGEWLAVMFVLSFVFASLTSSFGVVLAYQDIQSNRSLIKNNASLVNDRVIYSDGEMALVSKLVDGGHRIVYKSVPVSTPGLKY